MYLSIIFFILIKADATALTRLRVQHKGIPLVLTLGREQMGSPWTPADSSSLQIQSAFDWRCCADVEIPACVYACRISKLCLYGGNWCVVLCSMSFDLDLGQVDYDILSNSLLIWVHIDSVRRNITHIFILITKQLIQNLMKSTQIDIPNP